MSDGLRKCKRCAKWQNTRVAFVEELNKHGIEAKASGINAECVCWIQNHRKNRPDDRQLLIIK